MITLKDFMEVTNYQYTESAQYQWKCFGDTAQSIDYWNRDDDGFTISITHDLMSSTVYVMEVFDYNKDNERAWRWINPNFVDSYYNDAKSRSLDPDEAYDGVKFIDCDEKAIMKEARKLMDPDNKTVHNCNISGEPNKDDSEDDSLVELDLKNYEILSLALEAHRRDITLNQMVELVLMDAIQRYKKKDE